MQSSFGKDYLSQGENKDGIECVWEIKKTAKGHVERELPPEEMPVEAVHQCFELNSACCV